ncbi:uncharacterized protein LOC111314471 isoform X2 [Durio zibethinus]|uniref:Uncharacterized protein LOC111314471 isoform X2 n=1 Tax=Durio zibethinus TaxID=66656 RepID=A0A6P6B337_DURZI|nr:uncharacterized protein LOC111314471 isoform X2 [Durio zibethinus]
MAASANPTGNNQEGSSNQKVTAPPPPTNGVSVNSNNSGGNTCAAAVSADSQSALRHNPGISVDWTPYEQSILEDLLAKYASDSTIVRYAKIAMQLKDKTVRDVALRCRWMTKKENGKRRKEDHNSSRKNKDRREKGTDSSAKSTSHLTTRPNGPSYALPMIPTDNDDGIPCKGLHCRTLSKKNITTTQFEEMSTGKIIGILQMSRKQGEFDGEEIEKLRNLLKILERSTVVCSLGKVSSSGPEFGEDDWAC